MRDVGQRDVCSSPDWTCLYGDGVERVGERRVGGARRKGRGGWNI